MSNPKNKSTKTTNVVPRLTEVIGTSSVLPGESVDEYRKGVKSLTEELEALESKLKIVRERLMELSEEEQSGLKELEMAHSINC